MFGMRTSKTRRWRGCLETAPHTRKTTLYSDHAVIVAVAVCGGPAIVVPQRLGEVDVHLRGGARQVRRAETCIRSAQQAMNTLENSKVVYGQIAPLSFAVIVHVRLR